MANSTLWAEGFQEPKDEFPERKIFELIEPFEDVTQNLASLRLHRLEGTQRITSDLDDNEFQFGLILVSNLLPSYSFEVLRFGYPVTLYPVDLIIEGDIANELGFSRALRVLSGGRKVKCPDENSFIEVMKKVLTSTKFSSTVGGLVKVAREFSASADPEPAKPKGFRR